MLRVGEVTVQIDVFLAPR